MITIPTLPFLHTHPFITPESIHHYNDFIFNLPIAVCVQRIDGYTEYVNNCILKLTGYEHDELAGNRWWDVFTPGESFNILQEKVKLIESGKPVSYDSTLLTREGRAFVIHWLTTIARDDENREYFLRFGFDITPIRKIEEEHINYEALFRNLSETCQEAIISFDGNRIFTANDTFIRLFHYTREELFEIKDPSVLFSNLTWKDVENHISRHQPIGEVEAVTREGIRFPVKITGRRVPYRSGTIQVLFIQDLSEFKKIQDSLQRDRDLLNKIMQTSPIGIVLIDRESKITYANEKASRLLGYSPGELHLLRFTDTRWQFKQCDGKAFSSDQFPLLRVIENNETISNVCHSIQQPDGTTLRIAVSAAPLVENQGKSAAVIATLEDITDQFTTYQKLTKLTHQLEEQAATLELSNSILRRERDVLNTLMDINPIGILQYDSDGLIIFANRQAEETLGLSKSEITHRSYDDPRWQVRNCTGKLQSREEMGFYRVRESGQPLYDDCVMFEWPDSRWRLFSLNYVPLFDENGVFDGVIATVEDITDRINSEKETVELNRQLEERARELANSNENLEQFAFAASHDLKEPLNTILGYARLLRDRTAESLDPDCTRYLEYIIEDALRMNELISGILSLARITTETAPLEPLDSEDALQQAIDSLDSLIKENRAEITAGLLPIVMADEVQLVSLFKNLLTNSIKFRKQNEAPRINISARFEDGMWHFFVKDNSLGIDEKYLEDIFKTFHRLPGMKKIPGYGMGLALCRKIVERHGGRIWGESQLGKGSTFHFTLQSAENHDTNHPRTVLEDRSSAE